MDGWLEFKFSDAPLAQELLSTAQTLRSALDQLMDGKLQEPTGDLVMPMNVIICRVQSGLRIMNVIILLSACLMNTVTVVFADCATPSIPSGSSRICPNQRGVIQ